MDSNDQEQKFIGKLLSIAMAEFQKKGMPRESPHIYNRFRCPIDGSTMTQAIQEILDAACTSWDVDGRRVPAQANSPLLNKYRPGPKPRIHYEFIPIAFFFLFLVFVALGLWQGSSATSFSLVALAFSVGAFLLFWESRKNLPEKMAKWEKRNDIATHHWHCHQCGHPFLPKPLNRKGTRRGAPGLGPTREPHPEIEEDPQPSPENVSLLLPNPSGTKDVEN